MLDEGNAIAVALGVLRRQAAIDAEAIAAVLLRNFHAADVAHGLTRGLGLGCSADAVCALAQPVSPERVKAAEQVLIEAGMSDLVQEGPPSSGEPSSSP